MVNMSFRTLPIATKGYWADVSNICTCPSACAITGAIEDVSELSGTIDDIDDLTGVIDDVQ